MGIPALTYNNKTYDFETLTHDEAKFLLQHRQEAGMSNAQTKRAESLLSDEEREEILYSDNESKARGEEAMSLDADGDGEDDIKKNEDGSTDGGEGGGAGAATAGSAMAAGGALGATIAAIVTGIHASKDKAGTNGWIACITGGLAVAGGILAVIFSSPTMFDKSHDKRKAFSDRSQDLINQIDSQHDTLVNNMDLMNEDMEKYQEQSEEYTEAASGASADMAELKIQLADAQAAGDVDLIAETEEKIAALGEEDFSDMEDGMQETRDHMEGYSSVAEEGKGMVSNGKMIAEFLQVGNKLSELAKIDKGLLMAGSIMLGIITAIAAIPKVYVGFIPADGPAAIAAVVLYGLATASMGMATSNMGKNVDEQTEFGKNGNLMAEHIKTLDNMIGEHQGYMETTVEEFDKMDQESEETQEENAKTSTDAVTEKTGEVGSVRVGGHKNKDENHNGIPDDEEDENGNGRVRKGGLVGTGPKKTT